MRCMSRVSTPLPASSVAQFHNGTGLKQSCQHPSALECDVPSSIHLTAQRSALQEYAKLAMTKGALLDLASRSDSIKMDTWCPIAAGPVGKLLSEFNASEVDQARKSRP